MSPGSEAQIIMMIGDVKASVEEIRGDVKVLKKDMALRPCQVHTEQINETAKKLHSIDKASAVSAKKFLAYVCAALIAMIPLALFIMKIVKETIGGSQ